MYSNTSAYNQFANSDLGTTAYGYYLECGYDISKMLKIKNKLVPFVRYSNYNTHYQTNTETPANPNYDQTIITTGLSLFLDEAFVAKADFQRFTDGNNNTNNQVNLGLGFWFR